MSSSFRFFLAKNDPCCGECSVMSLEFGDTASLCMGSKNAQDFILGYSQPSLSGLDRFR